MAKRTKDADIELGKCKIDDHRPCELATAVNFASEISSDYGTPVPAKLDAILKSKKVSENQVRAALEEWRYTLPKRGQSEAGQLIEVAFPSN